MSPTGLELLAVTQDVGQAHEDLDAKYEGAELTVAFNPEYLAPRRRGDARRRGHDRDRRRAQAGRCCARTETEDFLYLLMPVRVQ